MSGTPALSGINRPFPAPFVPRCLPRVANREYLLNPDVQGLPPRWLKHLWKSFSPTPASQLHPQAYYPLDHHTKIIRDWFMYNPGRYHPSERRWNLNSLTGNVEDNCHPPYHILTLIAAALNGAPGGQLTSQEVRLALMMRYNFFLTLGPEWHAAVDNVMANNPQYFSIFDRKPNLYDAGVLYGLKLEVPTDNNCSATNIYLKIGEQTWKPTRPSDFQKCHPERTYADAIKGSYKVSRQRGNVKQAGTNPVKYSTLEE
ncbi:hypothetical protein Clacol_003333 [Clathrus columnatus]|uniref:Uncharacterized protein n=1 Tax=Clathrus columnatus TaxID=1419009 RepID=A0AAV5A980_9AGAM|nr:hypothetical protein Clacol_003333 [Clathrus columnatus]